MTPKCTQAVRAAAGGRQVSDAKIRAIEGAIDSTLRELARQAQQEARQTGKPNRWLSMSRDQQMAEAVTKAMQDLQAEASLKEYRAGLQVVRASETDEAITQIQQGQKVSRSQALARFIERVHVRGQTVRNEFMAQMEDMLRAAESTEGVGPGRFLLMKLFDVDNPQMTADIVREVFKNADGHTGNTAARKAAKSWLDVIEQARVRFNTAGGAIGKLGYGYIGQAHDWMRVHSAGADAWSAKVLPLLDRESYVNPDGSLMSDAQVLDTLKAAHETIATQGDNKVAPGQFKGSGARANRGSDSRVLHFKDGDAWMAYMKDYGEGSLYDSMLGHIGAMGRDIALVETMGPNPEQTFKVQNDIADRADRGSVADSRAVLNKPQAYWDLATGKAGMPENQLVARIGQDARNIQTAAKLGGAFLSSFTDIGTIAATLGYNRLPYFAMLGNIGRQFTADQRAFLQSHEVISDSLANSMNRWAGEHMTHSMTGRAANAVMKLSLMNAWTDGLRGAFAATMMQGFTPKLGKAWGDLSEWDRMLMERKGITEADWSIITQATPTDRNGRGYLTADSIRATRAEGAQAAANKWMGFVMDEAQFAIINPDLATRAIGTGGGMQAGTPMGEAARAFMQFKSFPTAMITRHWRRMLETPQGLEGAPTGYGGTMGAGNKVALFAGLNVTLMMLGAIVLQNKALVQGKDPFDMTEGKFWARALTQGGGLGYVGDLLFKDPTEFRATTFEQTAGVLLGPSGGAAAGLVFDVGVTNLWELAKDKDTKAGAEALRWLNSNLPGANLWQTRAMWEHWVLHNMQEALNPGYLARMKQRAQRDWGQGYWWEPGEAVPDRAPDFSRMGGE